MAGIQQRHPAWRWLAPAAAVALVAAGSLAASAAASADDGLALPPRSAEQLLADVLQPTTTALSGTVRLHVDLGLPEIPGLSGGVDGTGVVPGGATDAVTGGAAAGLASVDGLTDLLTGDHTLRVWADAEQHRARLAVIADGEETDVVHDGTDLWLWQSDGSRVLHATLPELALPDAGALEQFGEPVDPALLAQLPKTPQEAAAALLEAAGDSTEITTESTADVAGRPAYLLVASPRTDGTLVDRIVVAIDAQTHVPLRLDVYSTQRVDPAVSFGFTSVSFAAPPDDVFSFAPPAGATVTEVPGDLAGGADLPQRPTTPPGPDDEAAHPAHPDVTTTGEGWATVVVLTPPAGRAQALLLGDGDATFGWGGGDPAGAAAGILAALPQVSGPWGSGHALAGTLFSVLVADDGRVAAGAVPVAALEDALAGSTP